MVLFFTATTSSQEAEVKIARGSAYGALKCYSVQVNDTEATIHDPDGFSGKHTIQFDQGSGSGYTEVELIGHDGMAQVGLEDGYADTFGYHVGAGFDLRIFKGLYLDVGYRYYWATDSKITPRDQWIEYSNSGQMAHIGLSYLHQMESIEYSSGKGVGR